MDSSGDDFEDDPFSYKPLKRRKLAAPSQIKDSKVTQRKQTAKAKTKPTKPSETRQRPTISATQTKRKSRAPSPILATKLPKVTQTLADLLNRSQDKSICPPEPVKVTNTECPICQLPLHLLTGVISSTNHLADCADGSLRLLPPCPQGVLCSSKVVNHYARFDHAELARHRDMGLINQTTEIVDPGDVTEIASLKFQSPTISTQAPPIPRFSSTRIHNSQAGVVAPTAEYISPIKIIRRSSQANSQKSLRTYKCDLCERTFLSEAGFEEHVCVQKEVSVRTPSPVRKLNISTPHIRTEHQRRFLREIASDQARGSQESDLSTSLLARNKTNRTKNWVNFSKSDIFDEDLQNQIEKAISNVDNDVRTHGDIVEGVSEKAGPSGINNNRRRKQSKPNANQVKVIVDDREVDVSLEPSIVDPQDNNEAAEARPKDPIKVSAEKDSQELELSLHIDPAVHCNRLRVRVPLKKTDSGADLPVEVSANYTDVKSPVKQAQITEYFKNNGRVVSGGCGTGSNTPSTAWSDLGVVKLSTAKKEWNKIFSRAKAKGYIAPTLDNSQKSEKVVRKEKVKRKPPWHKVITDTRLAVDAFNYGDIPGVKYYLLSHYHYDHYVGLDKNWTQQIVCSSITKRLASTFSGVKETLFITLDPGESRVVGGCELTSVDANHCPGSVMFVIRMTSGVTLLHVGDCRAGHGMEEEPVFWNLKIDKLYLDTTYCRPEYDFPSQSDVITRTVEVVVDFVTRNPNTVVMVGAYTVGKERIFKAIASGLEAKVWGDSKRVRTWRCLEDSDILGRLVGDRKRAQVHVVMNQLVSWPKLGQELDKLGTGSWSHVLGVKPTGWSHSRGVGKEQSLDGVKVETRGQCSMLEVPYSEHSSYSELKRFVQFLRMGSEMDIIPTVNERNTDAMRAMFKKWIAERKALGPESQ